MATTLTEQVSHLRLSTYFPESFPKVNPVDVYRIYITQQLATITGVDSSIIYPSLQWTQKLEQGDLTLPVPRLRIKGAAPTDLAQEWAKNVRSL